MNEPSARAVVSHIGLPIRPLTGETEARFCANLIVTSEPRLTIGRTSEQALRAVSKPTREVHVATLEQQIAGFVVLDFQGPFAGYLHTLAVAEGMRGRGIGTALIAFAEQRIFRDHSNVFLCVSSFNQRAQKLYTRLGYEFIGELKDFAVRCHSEFLVRKKRTPLPAVTNAG
jgi:ribosomal-protein-alanine N-acetyltransferase